MNMCHKSADNHFSWSAKTALTLTVTSMCHALGNAQTLEDVVVSASRAEQRSFDAPAAIESIDRGTIENAGPQVNLSESLNRIPGLTILNRQNYAQDLQVSIRGFGARSAFGIRGIRLLVDGIPATTPDGQGQGSSISLTSTDRIEVMRGPLAQMYGNSSGGVIQAFTRNAPDTPEFLSQLYTGSYGLRRSDWQYAGKAGKYSLVADYSTFSTDGYRNNSQAERKQFNGKLSFDANEDTRVNIVFNRFDMPMAQDPLGLTTAQLAADPQQAGKNAVSSRVRKITLQNQIGSTVTHQLDADRSLTARAYYGTRENLQFLASNAPNGISSNWVGLDRNYDGAGLQYNQRTRIGGRPVDLLAGYDFDYSKERRQGGAAVRGEKTPGSLTRNEDNTAQNSDFFAQATTLALDNLSVITGLRASTVKFSSKDFFLADGNNGSGSVSFRSISPVLGLTWHVSDNLNLYTNYGQGFETPTLAELALSDNGGAAPVARFNPALKAADSRHYEIGAKWLPTPQSRLDVNLYRIGSTDEIVVSRSVSGQSAFKNAPGTTRTGIELGGNVLLNPHLRASLSASWINARFSQTFASNGVTVASGNKLPGIPQHFVFSEMLWSSQTLGGNNKSAIARGIQAGLELTNAGKLYANDVNIASADGYTTLNAKASQGWQLGRALLVAYGRIDNLTNQRYVGSVIVNQAAGQFFEPAPGRTWTLGKRRFIR